ncbi:hypothetical protein predicted by Glimmer/Critica [Bordetella petrii]|uniref:Uncharacterized protein n=2 Tax=Bordetella petrii TaxID=94624 RepID=A9I983_BORPD|nr:hypothetical protein predicted by Glimmer/Critica [Bordetella petrii]
MLATFSAVLASLWLARRPDRLDLKGRAGIRIIVTPGVRQHQEMLMLEVINTGRRPAKVTFIGWEYVTGWRRKKNFVQMTDQADGLSSSLPVVLDDGAEARWCHPFEQWASMVEKFTGTENSANFERLNFVFGTSVGQQYKVRVEKSLSDRLQKIWESKRKGDN